MQFAFSNLDEIFKELFDFFKDTTENEFESFETKTIEVNNIKDLIKGFVVNKGKNVKFSISQNSLLNYDKIKQGQPPSYNVINEIIMGDKFQVGDIINNSGQIIFGKDIKVSDSLNDKNETADKITELINLIRQEHTVNDEQRLLLITEFHKIKKELFEDKPSKPEIFKWLSSTKKVFENLVLSHEITQAIDWIYKSLNFIIH